MFRPHAAVSDERGIFADSPCVVKLQRQVVPVFIVRRNHGLQGAGVVPPPAVTQVDHPVLTPTQLRPELRLAWEQTKHYSADFQQFFLKKTHSLEVLNMWKKGLNLNVWIQDFI